MIQVGSTRKNQIFFKQKSRDGYKKKGGKIVMGLEPEFGGTQYAFFPSICKVIATCGYITCSRHVIYT